MTFSKADRASIDRLTDALNELAAAIKERTRQPRASIRIETQSIKLITDWIEAQPKKRPARKKTP